MRHLILVSLLVISNAVSAQVKKAVGEFFKGSTMYSTAFVTQPFQDPYGDWFIPRDWTVDPEPLDNQNKYNFNYSLGIRKIARFRYENRPAIFYDGTETNISTQSNIGAVRGWEYLFHTELSRQLGEEFVNNKYFLRHLGKRHILKVERFQDGFVSLNYDAVDLRYRKPVGSKLNLSVGLNVRGHGYYGIAPIKQYLEDADSDFAWLGLAWDAGYRDYRYGTDMDNDGTIDGGDYIWTDKYNGDTIALSDWEFRKLKWDEIAGAYNDSVIDVIGSFRTLSPVIGLDFYHRTKENWLHIWGSVLPYNTRISGNEEYFWGNNHDDWIDFQVGFVSGMWITKNLGLYFEGSRQRFWDRQLYSLKCGINYQFR